MVDPEALGLTLTAFISVKPIDPAAPDDVPDRLKGLEEVEDCYSVAGDENYILKVRVGTPGQLEACCRGSAPPRMSRPGPRSCSPPFEARMRGTTPA